MFDKYCVWTYWLHALEEKKKKNGVSSGGWKLIANWWGYPALLDGVCLC